jgi:plasmid replication initiation protein
MMVSSATLAKLPASITEAAVIRQHNVITSARYDYSSCQMDILFYLISQLGRHDDPNHEYLLHIKDIEQLTSRQWNYQQLREATADMGSRMFEVESEQSYKQLWMFQRVEYLKGKGCVQIQLAEPIRPFLFNLKENFTSYELHSALKLSSKYAKRIYQFVSQWKDKDATPTYSLDEFKQMLSLKDPKGKQVELFQNISQLKARVLDVAVRQINEHTDLRIDYLLFKTGKAYDRLRFTIARQQTRQLPIEFDRPVEESRSQSARQHLETLGITLPKLVQQILGDPEMVDKLFKFIYQLKTGQVKSTKNPAGLFLKMCGLR